MLSSALLRHAVEALPHLLRLVGGRASRNVEGLEPAPGWSLSGSQATTASTSDPLVGPDRCFNGPYMTALFSMKTEEEEVEAEVVLLIQQT